MSIIKSSQKRNLRVQTLAPDAPRPIYTALAYYLIWIGVVVMGILFLSNVRNVDDLAWVKFTVYMMLFGIAGIFGPQITYQQPLFPKRELNQFKKLDWDTGLRCIIITVVCELTQIIVAKATAYSFTIEEQALYYIFAAVVEEAFFRVLIMGAVLRLKDDLNTGIIAIILQDAAFVALHQNYYSNLPMLISVAMGGLVLGIFYYIWRDATANILAHFLINLIAVKNLLVLL